MLGKSGIESPRPRLYKIAIMPSISQTPAQARTARRRSEWKLELAHSFAEAEAQTRAYWRSASSAERLNALETLRKPFYGKDQTGGRLQRFLEVVPAP